LRRRWNHCYTYRYNHGRYDDCNQNAHCNEDAHYHEDSDLNVYIRQYIE
jgi:hypothetical protein